MSKTLVAYFSASGVTAKLAKMLADTIGADLHEIQPENDKSFRPVVATRVENMEQYNRVFIGFPIWWYVAPTIINSFLEQHDLTGKKVIPFATSGGSGMGNTNAELAASCRGSVLCEGKRFNTNVKATELKAWAEKF